jgi:hypothetical protein
MKGDFSRKTYDLGKNYKAVLEQQGRVHVDADANEQVDIIAHQRETRTRDGVGPCGAPLRDAGYRILPDGADPCGLMVSSGRYYVDGLLCELHPASRVRAVLVSSSPYKLRLSDYQFPACSATDPAPVLVFTREHPDGVAAAVVGTEDEGRVIELDAGPAGESLTGLARQFPVSGQPGLVWPPEGWPPTEPSTYLAYLDVWERHITAIEDPHIREIALGGPDTTTRSQTVAQVKLHKVAGDPTCCEAMKQTLEAHAPSRGRLTTSTEPQVIPSDPCQPAGGGGYRGLENRLYRVEIHDTGDIGSATFKWSRDNGSVAYGIADGGFVHEPTDSPACCKVRLRELGRDQYLQIKTDDRVEISTDETDLSGEPRSVIAQVTEVDEANRELTFDQDVAALEDGNHPKVRRWDTGEEAPSVPTVIANSDPVHLEDGVYVKFSGDNFQPGDDWVFAARTADRSVETLDAAAAMGIRHHYCPLALVKWGPGNVPEITDCRSTFVPLTKQVRFFRVGGNGQETPPGKTFADPFCVGVAKGIVPEERAEVRFTAVVNAEHGGCEVQDANGVPLTGSVETMADGTVSCFVKATDPTDPKPVLVKATLEYVTGVELPDPRPVLYFNGSICSGGGERCPKFLDELRSDGIVRDAKGELGFELTWSETSLELKHSGGVAYVGGCRYDIPGGTVTPTANDSATHQAVLVDIEGAVRLVYKDPLPEKCALIAFVSTYQGSLTQVVDVRRDLYHLDEQVQVVRESAAARRADRRQFSPLLASTLRDVMYVDGRNREFKVRDPQGLAFDGRSVWVASSRAAGEVTRIDRQATAPKSGEKVPMVIGNRRYLTSRAAFDGHRYVWFTSSGSILEQGVLPKAPSPLEVSDIADWQGFLSSLSQAGKAAEPSPGKRIWEMLPSDVRDAVEESAAGGSLREEQKTAITKAMNDSTLGRRDFYEAGYFSGVAVPEEAGSLLADTANLSDRDVQRVNRFLLAEAIAAIQFPTTESGTLVLVDTLRADAPRIAITVGPGPDAIAFDGDFMWVGCQDRTLHVINCETRQVVRTIDLGRGTPQDLVFDGQYMWAVCAAESKEGRLWRIDKPWGEPQDFGAIVPGIPSRAVFDGAKLWVAHETSGAWSILSLDPLRPKQEDRSVVMPSLTGVRALVFDGKFVWVTHTWQTEERRQAFGLLRIDPVLGVVNGSVEIPEKLVPAYGLFDGTHIWLSSGPDERNAREYVRKVLLL